MKKKRFGMSCKYSLVLFWPVIIPNTDRGVSNKGLDYIRTFVAIHVLTTPPTWDEPPDQFTNIVYMLGKVRGLSGKF